MSEEGINFAALLDVTNGFGKHALAAIQSVDSIQAIAKPPAFPDNATLWAHASERVAAELGSVLEGLKVSNVIAGGWNTYRELQEYTDPAKYPPTETVTCVLGKHSMDFTHNASIDILINGAKSTSVDFEATVHLDLEGAILTIKAGRIMAAMPVQCQLSAELELGTAQIAERKLGSFDLGAFTFADGIPISSQQPAAAGH